MLFKKYIKIFISLSIASCFIYSQSFKVEGKITDSGTSLPLSYASVRIAGTTTGTSANYDGQFSLKLKKGSYKLIFSFIGYKTDSLKISVPLKETIKIGLEVQSIKLPEVVVNADEDPAYSIIREAIKRKEENRKGLNNFEYNAYSKRIITSAGEVAVIEEVFLKGYNKVNEWAKEFIQSTFRTENIKKSNELFDFRASDNYYIDFWSDTLSLGLSLFYLPLAKNAFDHYDYKLLKIIEAETHLIYLIKVIPRSKIQPLLEGEITIESDNYAMTSENLRTNEGLRFPFLNNFSMGFVQQLGKYNNYWLPNYVESKIKFNASFQGLLTIEPIEFHQLSSITEYKINGVIPDSVENAVDIRYGYFTTDTTKTDTILPEISKHEIEEIRPIPLTLSEVEAYAELDSTKKLEKMIKFGGPLSGFIPEEDEEMDTTKGFLLNGLEALNNYGLFRNNRATGILLGTKYEDEFFEETVKFNLHLGYSFDRKKAEGKLLLNYFPKNIFVDSFEAEIFHYTKNWQSLTPYPDIANSAAVLLGFDDYFNYYLSTGFAFGIGFDFGKSFSAGIKFINEKHESLTDLHHHSIFNTGRKVRANPAVTEGMDNKASLDFILMKNPLEIQLIPENGIITRVDISNPSLDSDFNYKSYRLIGTFNTKTFYDELFIAPYLQLTLDAGIVIGE
ncbi:MAG: DUF5686 family protein, partial [Ignavibacteria bacterium]